MDLDELLLKLFKHREKYERYSPVMNSKLLKSASLPHSTLQDFGAWFKENPEAQVIDEKSFMLWSKLKHNIDGPEADWLIGDNLVKARGEVPPEIEGGLMARIATEVKALEVEALLEEYKSGKNLDLYTELRARVDTLGDELNRKAQVNAVEVSIEDLLAEEKNNDGLRWRLKCLNEASRPLRPGDFIIVAARPDAGKTSFLSSELTFMASQLPEGRPIIWLNNEGPGRRIIGRVWQAALGASMAELEELSRNKVLYSSYAEAVGGPSNIRVYDVHDFMSHEIEDLIKAEKPAMVVFDMIDNVRFSGMNHHGGTRTDQLLETMYQWARSLGVKYECVIMATSQVSADGEGEQWPNQATLKDSKTGKQGAADMILMIGKDNTDSDARYLSMPKNKLARPHRKCPKAKVIFDRVRSRFSDSAMAPMPSAPTTSVYEDDTPY